ncbi:MIND complex subunit [Maudiozyma humilis]|uniref:MIND complex subunit n=1 Tax=Maudiozyma humilis TaxID=51915 RepID=A0AAV5RYT3_MAUHU|nr:MIND complex subunit [Kazachstania humilis]
MSKKIDVSAEQVRAIYAQLMSALQEHAHTTSDTTDIPRDLQVYLQDYLLRVMDASAPSLDVLNLEEGPNGPTASTSTTQQLLSNTQQRYVEPLDTALNERVRQTYQEWEDLTVKVAQLRREGPQRVAALYRDDAAALLQQIDREIAEGDATVPPPSSASPSTTAAAASAETYTAVLAQLQAAKEQLPETRAAVRRLAATLQRARTDTQ